MKNLFKKTNLNFKKKNLKFIKKVIKKYLIKMEVNIKDIFVMESFMVKESTFLKKVADMKEPLIKVYPKDMEL
jgi:hypothetical protein